jgi:ribosomal-protein-alanine N-acetyltransferase
VYRFETERLSLRRFTRDDVGIHRLVYGDPEVGGRWFSRLRSPAEVRDWLVYREQEGANDDLGFWAVVRKEDHGLLGLVALQYYVASWIVLEHERAAGFNSVEVELSYALGRAYWGEGYATEAGRELVDHAFRRLRLERLVNAVDRENVRSIGVMQRLGFRLEPNLHPDGADAVVGVLENRAAADAGISATDIGARPPR